MRATSARTRASRAALCMTQRVYALPATGVKNHEDGALGSPRAARRASGRGRAGAGGVAAVAARGIVPEQLSPRRLRQRRPAEDRVDRLREPALRVRIVGGKHQRVLAERVDGLAQRQLTLVELDALKIL